MTVVVVEQNHGDGNGNCVDTQYGAAASNGGFGNGGLSNAQHGAAL